MSTGRGEQNSHKTKFQRSQSANSAATTAATSEQNTTYNNNATAAGADTPEPPSSFAPIIADIMRGFGDCDKPLDDTVQLVERILLHQLRGILHDVIAAADDRKGAPEPTRTDFEYVMRHNPVKVLRLQQHIRDLQLKRKLEELHRCRVAPGGLLMMEDELDTNGVHSDSEDADRSVAARYDEEKVRRVFRADRISQQLNGEQYMRYNEARKTSFSCKNSTRIRMRLRSWLRTDFKLSNQVFTILAYLAHETIAVLVDYAILTRLHSGNRSNEPFGRVLSSRTTQSMLHLCPEVTQGRGMDGLQAITTHEVHEAMRRLTQSTNRTLGPYRGFARSQTMPYLAF